MKIYPLVEPDFCAHCVKKAREQHKPVMFVWRDEDFEGELTYVAFESGRVTCITPTGNCVPRNIVLLEGLGK